MGYWLLKKTIPGIRIRSEEISIGEANHHFNTNRNKLKRVDIGDEGGINIMEVWYASDESKLACINELGILVPMGKLKEAVMIQEKLSGSTQNEF